MLFRDYDQTGLDRQYDQRVWAANAEQVIRRYADNSDRVRQRLGEPLVFAYGDSAAETLDLYPGTANPAPIHLFIHGGAWRQLDKGSSAFAAENFVANGAHFIAADFALLPTVTLAEMVAQVRRAIAWTYRNADRFGGDRERIHVSGHSSGAHLAACVAVTDWRTEFGLPGDIVKSVICASGIYDLLPVRLSARNLYVKLDEAAEQALSPIRHLDRLAAPVHVAIGERESDEFKRQARSFAAALGPALVAPLAELASLNHFEVAETLADPTGGLGGTALALMKGSLMHPAA